MKYVLKGKQEEGSDPKGPLSTFKYSIVVLNKEGSLVKLLGITEKEQFYLGNFVAKPNAISSEKKVKQDLFDNSF